jgi:hypothetical protein
MLGLVERQMEIRRQDSRLAVHFKDDSAQAVSSVLVGILLPLRASVQARSARLEAMIRFHEVGLATHNFHAAYHRLPTSSYDKQGRPLLSWRVFISPFLGQDALFGQFRLDEPWNSEHNLALLEKMPDVYRDPEHDSPFKTTCLRPAGKGALFVKGKDDEGRSLPEVAACLTKEGLNAHSVLIDELPGCRLPLANFDCLHRPTLAPVPLADLVCRHGRPAETFYSLARSLRHSTLSARP